MKFTIDTDLKQITIQGDCNLIELVDKLTLLLGEEITDYKIVTETKINFEIPYFPVQPYIPSISYYSSPIIVNPIPPFYTTCDNLITNSTIKS